MNSRIASIVSLVLFAGACVDGDAASEASLAVAAAGPAEHGALAFGTADTAALTARASAHAWHFRLTAPATVTVATGLPAPKARAVDTVLRLYRRGPSGWGRHIARNDDAGGTPWSALTRALGAGEYRIVVAGARDTTRGTFAVRLDCAGLGCTEPVPMCVFGETFRDLDSQPALRVTGRRRWTATTRLTELDRRRVVIAVQQSSHTDVTTPEEAFARVDQGEINRVDIYEPAAARTFVALEYGVGDNSYGAFFDGLGDTLVARIHDGDILDCAVVAETCLLGATYGDLRQSPDFTAAGARRITAPGDVAGLEAEQVVRAVQESHADVRTVADALAAVDGGEINLARFVHRATGTELLAVEYGAGDNSYGAVFYSGSLSLAAAIHDGDFYGCTFFASTDTPAQR